MKVRLVPSSVSENHDRELQYLTSILINDTVAIDAGPLGYFGTAQDQAKIRHVLISHTHIDHVASLPILVENAYEGRPDCLTVHGSEVVLDSIQNDLFNDRVWPDFIKLSTINPKAPFIKLTHLEAGKTITLEGLRITPIPVDHVVPTLGFLVDDGSASILVVSDTGPTELIWQYANAAKNLKAVFLEVAFPNSMLWLAKVSKHLTPTQFGEEVGKLKQPAMVYAVHIKARFRPQILDEVKALGLSNVEIARFDKPYMV